MATFTVNRNIKGRVGPFEFDIVAGATQSCPDDLFDEVKSIIEGTSGGYAVTRLTYDRESGGLGSVTLTGTPTTGQVVTATSSAAAEWATPASSTLTTKDEGVQQSTAVSVLNVVGDALAISGAGATATLTSTAIKNTGGGLEVVQAHGAMGATETFDLANGNIHTGTLDANCVLSFAGATSGKECTLSIVLTQDSTGSRTVTWPAAVSWPGSTTPTLATAAASVDEFVFLTEDGGATWRGHHLTKKVYEADISTSDVTTGNATTAKHGFLIKLDGSSTKFLNGVGAFAVPTSSSTLGSVQTYTPSWTSDGTQPTTGNATLSGRYRLLDSSLMWIGIRFVFGSTSANGTGAYRFSLPAAYRAIAAANPQVVAARILDSGTRHYSGTGYIDPSTAYFLVILSDTAGTAIFSHTQPITLATGDEVNIEGIIEYEAA